MFTKWLATRASGMAKKDHSFRPWLESLEERNAPGGWGHDGGGDHGHGHGHNNGNGGNNTNIVGPINAPTLVQSGNVHNNIHNNIHITNSFNNNTNSFNGIPTSGGVFLSPPQTGAIGALFALSGLIAAETSSSSLGSLINDEIALAVDNYLLAQPAISAVSSLSSSLTADASSLAAAIHANSLESTFIGPIVGSLAYDVTSNALMSAQPTI